MPTLDGVNVKRLDDPNGPGVLLESSEILLTLAAYIAPSFPLHAERLREVARTVDCDLALSDRTLFGLTDDEWPAHNPYQREYPDMPSSEAEWRAHVAFYRLTAAQRNRAWKRIQELELAYREIASVAARTLDADDPAQPLFAQAAEEGP